MSSADDFIAIIPYFYKDCARKDSTRFLSTTFASLSLLDNQEDFVSFVSSNRLALQRHVSSFQRWPWIIIGELSKERYNGEYLCARKRITINFPFLVTS